MAQNVGQTIGILAALGIGGYAFFEYSSYNTALNAIATANGLQLSALQAILPFFTYLQYQLGMSQPQAQTQAAGLYNAIQNYQNPPAALSTSTAPTPGTTPSGQVSQTTVTNAPASTTTAQASTTPNTTPSALMTLANNMQSNLGMTTANPDQWNLAFGQIMGQAIDAKYGFNFDSVYGSATQRANEKMSALMFLQTAAGAVTGGLPGLSGLGAISRFPVPSYSTTGNMMYLVHHPLPYSPTYRGFGAFTQATGFERALFGVRVRK